MTTREDRFIKRGEDIVEGDVQVVKPLLQIRVEVHEALRGDSRFDLVS